MDKIKQNNIIALLLAGGHGLRIHTTRPKQFIETEGESILLHTMKAFERHPLVKEIWVVCHPEWNNYVVQQARIGQVSKFQSTLEAGATSYHSLQNGIHGLEHAKKDPESIVLVHESVRPFVTHEIISSNIHTCMEKGNAVTAIGSHEAYIKLSDKKEGQMSNGYIPREELMRAQTPITFRLEDLSNIIQKAQELGIQQAQSLFTLANQVGLPHLHIVEGSLLNFKITLPLDVEVYNRLRTLYSF